MPDQLGASAVDGADVVFRLRDPGHALSGVRLWQDLGIPAEDLEFSPVDGGWELRIPRPAVRRVEYLFEVRDADGQTSRTDPGNPLVVGGAFGEHSWIPLPGYLEPDWLRADPVPSRMEPVAVEGTPVGAVGVQLWSPGDADSDEPLPLLLAHDGPDFARYAGLTHFAGAGIATGTLPRLRLALLSPGDRLPRYAANPAYATALVEHVLPAVTASYACRPGPVLMGASLGALAALHVEWAHPGTFAGLLLQSGSFFTPATDPQESGFGYFAEVTGFVAAVLGTSHPPSRPAIAMTAGSAEENVHNNRAMAAQLGSLGLDVEYAETPDVHCFTAWRDMLDPALTNLLKVWAS